MLFFISFQVDIDSFLEIIDLEPFEIKKVRIRVRNSNRQRVSVMIRLIIEPHRIIILLGMIIVSADPNETGVYDSDDKMWKVWSVLSERIQNHRGYDLCTCRKNPTVKSEKR